jgi:hypothetical protein
MVWLRAGFGRDWGATHAEGIEVLLCARMRASMCACVCVCVCVYVCVCMCTICNTHVTQIYVRMYVLCIFICTWPFLTSHLCIYLVLSRARDTQSV